MFQDVNVDDLFVQTPPPEQTTGVINKIEDVVYDPRVMTDDALNVKAVWTSESVKLAEDGMRDGYRLKDTPYLATIRGFNIRKAGVPFKYSDDELTILSKCMKDKVFYANNFGQLKDADKGWTNITLRDYQETLLEHYSNNRWNIVMFPRQSGKTTTTIVEIVHFVTFSVDKDCVVIAQSDKVVTEILDKIKEYISKQPYFMQPGVVSYNSKKGFVFENGCRLTVGVASESVVQGFSLDLLYIDEFAYIKPSMVNKFWENIYPSLTNNPQSRCIITSTPNGRNKFYEMWQSAVNKLSKFIPYRIYWQDVPGRDAVFKQDTIAIVGITGWLMGFECSFDAQLKSVFNSSTQLILRNVQQKYTDAYEQRDGFDWLKQDVMKYSLKDDYFIIGVDIAEGLEQDSSVIKVKKIDWDIDTKCLRYYSVGVYENNEIAVDEFATLLMDTLLWFDSKKIRVAIENNLYGGELFAHIDNLRYNNSNLQQEYLYQIADNKYSYNKYSQIDNTVFAKFERPSKNNDYERGIRWNLTNKPIGVKAFSTLTTDYLMNEYHSKSIEQYLNFGRQANGTYKANYGHDDLVMADVTISHFIKINNIYSVDFLREVEAALRERYVDPTIELQREQERRAKEIASQFHWRDFTQKVYKIPEQSEMEKMTLFS